MSIRTVVACERPLPWDDRPAAARGSIAGFQLDALAVLHFDQLLHDIYPDARHVDVDRIASLGRWLQELPVEEARETLDIRLARIEQLRRMLDDPDWDQREETCTRVRKLLAYLDQDADLIPADIPLLGLLDDVILLELAWPALAIEAGDYRDFCRFREQANPAGDGAQRRAAWVNDRLAELALFQHQHDVNSGHYARSGEPAHAFKIS